MKDDYRRKMIHVLTLTSYARALLQETIGRTDGLARNSTPVGTWPTGSESSANRAKIPSGFAVKNSMFRLREKHIQCTLAICSAVVFFGDTIISFGLKRAIVVV